jgi:hypothetical protein
VSRVSSAWPWAVTAAGVAAVVCLVGWPRPTLCVTGLITAAVALTVGLRMLFAEHGQTGRPPCAGCAGCGGPDCTERPEDAELTAQEARDLADDLGLQLYRAEDALAYVTECCDIADREAEPVTTARVREWLKGAQCARVSGLVLDPDGSGHDPETARTDPDEPDPDPAEQAGHDPDDLRTEYERVRLMLHASRELRAQAEATIARVRQMADAWEQQLPDTMRTAAAVDAIRTALDAAPRGA